MTTQRDRSPGEIVPPRIDGDEQYFCYLQKRSALARIYRNFWLYPRLCRYLYGEVLDLGCGIGDFLQFRAGTIGTDINSRLVSWCKGRGFEVKLMAPDSLPFEDARFDCVVIDNVLEHIAAPEALLMDVRRVLRHSGRVLVGVPGQRGFASDPDHKVFYDIASLTAVMKGSGFEAVARFYMPFGSAWLNRYMRQYCAYGVFERV